MPRCLSDVDVIVDELIAGNFSSRVASALMSWEAVSEQVSLCNRCDGYCRCDDTCTVDEDETWCDSCVESHGHYWESDGQYHSEQESSNDGLDDYHDNDRSALLRGVDMTCAELLGIEIETFIPNRIDVVEACRLRVPGVYFAEKDGSLDDDCGCEFVFRPMTLAELREPESTVQSVVGCIRQRGGTAWDAGAGYGMHISVNRAAMTGFHTAKFVRFWNENQPLCERFAGRKETHWARYHGAEKLPEYAKDRGKYFAARVDGNRVEVRIFRATLKPERIVRNAEFVDAVRVYTAQCAPHQCTEDAFLAWLAKPEQSCYQLLRKAAFKSNSTTE